MKIFEKNSHKIIWGDAIEVLKNEIQDNSIALIFADPPYNIGKNFNGTKDKWASDEAYIKWSYQWLDLYIKKLKYNGSFYVMTSTQNMPYFDIYLRKRLTIFSRIVWHYDSSGVQAKQYYGSLYEPILFCVRNFLDIDKIEKYPITFVVKSSDSISILEQKIQEQAKKQYSINTALCRTVNGVCCLRQIRTWLICRTNSPVQRSSGV